MALKVLTLCCEDLEQKLVPNPLMTKDLVIISAGKLGREVYGWATQAIRAGAPWRIKGFLDNREGALDGHNYDCKVLGNVHDYEVEENDAFIGAIGEPNDKVAYYTPILQRGGTFINLIHPSAVVGHNVEMGFGIIMAPFSCTTSDVKIGNFVAILPFSNVAHDCAVGSWTQISTHCGINGRAVLGEGVFVGGHSCVTPGNKVGDWAYIGAGSVVARDIPASTRVVGNPARAINIGSKS